MCVISGKDTCRGCEYSRQPRLFDGGCMHPDYPNILITAAKVEPLEPIDFEPVDFEPYTNEQLDEIFSI